MATSDAQKKARDKWNAKYVELRFRVTKERKEEIQSYATAKDESLSAFLNRAVDEAMEKGQDVEK